MRVFPLLVTFVWALHAAEAQPPEPWRDWPPDVFDGVGPLGPPVGQMDGIAQVGPVKPPGGQVDGLADVGPVKPPAAHTALGGVAAVHPKAPAGADAARSMVVALVQAGELQRAEDLAAQVWQQEGAKPASIAVQQALIQACLQARKADPAETAAARLRAAGVPEAAAMDLALGRAYLSVQYWRRCERAIEHFRYVLQGPATTAENAEAELGIARGHLLGRECDEAERHCDTVIDLRPRIDDSLVGQAVWVKGECAYYRKDYQNAQRLIREAVDLAGESGWVPWVQSDLVYVLLSTGQHEECAREAKEFMAKHAGAWNGKATLWDRARRVFSDRIEALGKLGRAEEAQSWIEEVGRANGSEWPVFALQRKARVLTSGREPPSADDLAALRDLLKPALDGVYGERGQVMACAQLGHAHYQAGDLGTAETLYAEASQHCESLPDPRQAQDYALLRDKQLLGRYAKDTAFFRAHPFWVAPQAHHGLVPSRSLVEKALKNTTAKGEARYGEPLRQVFDLQVLRVGDTASVLECVADNEAVTAAVEPAEADAGSRFAVPARLIVTVSPPLGATEVHGRVSVTSPSFPGYSLDVPVEVSVSDPVWAAPTTFYFGHVPPGATRTVKLVLSSHVPAFSLTAVTADKPERVTLEARKLRDNVHQVAATLTAPTQAGTIEGVITIAADVEGQPPLKLTYYARVE